MVGDSFETIGDFDLVLVGHGIEHGWEQHECENDKIREITIQFSQDLFSESFLGKNQLSGIRKMFEESSNGIVFPASSILKVYNRLDNLTKTDSGFNGVLELMAILNELAEEGNYRQLSRLCICVSETDLRQQKGAESASLHRRQLQKGD